MTLVDWRDGVIPVSRRFDDPYFSLDGGLAETGYVFLTGNGLPGRFGGMFRIGELGFGTGTNILALWDLWRRTRAPGPPGPRRSPGGPRPRPLQLRRRRSRLRS